MIASCFHSMGVSLHLRGESVLIKHTRVSYDERTPKGLQGFLVEAKAFQSKVYGTSLCQYAS